jgi:hypothetical protein
MKSSTRKKKGFKPYNEQGSDKREAVNPVAV